MIGCLANLNQTIDVVTHRRAIKVRHPGRRTAALIGGLVVLYAVAAPAAEIFQDGNAAIRWDNTLKYSAAFRLNNPDPALIADPNGDDGDRNFRAGVISDRVDLLSELGFRAGSFGMEASAAAWYDTVYNAGTDNTSPATFNPTSVPYDQFTAAVRRLHGRDAELLNAYMYDTFTVADMPLAVRIGRSNLLWGESLFFASNGIAAGQAPVDEIKALSVPGSEAKEVYMPVGQAWVSLQPRPGIAIEAYYQFEWRKDRLPGAGSYFSAADFLDAGGERVIVGPNQFFSRSPDQGASNSGQYGLAARFTNDSGDYGLYALRFSAKEPQIYLRLGPYNGGTAAAAGIPAIAAASSDVEHQSLYGYTPGSIVGSPSSPLPAAFYGLYGDAATGQVGTYNLVYPRGIELYGASFSGYLGNATVAGEISGRRNMPLVSNPLVLLPNVVADGDNSPRYAVGDTLHAQVSTVVVLPQSTLWKGATFAAEIAANHRLDITLNPTALDPTRTRTAVSMRLAFEPQYFAVLPGLDLTVPIGFGYGVAGRSSVDQSQNAKAGDFEIGLSATYRTVWTGQVSFTHFIGAVKIQPFADRDFISISVQRTF